MLSFAMLYSAVMLAAVGIVALIWVWLAMHPRTHVASAAVKECVFSSAYPTPDSHGGSNAWPVPCDYPPNGPDPGAAYWEPTFPWNNKDCTQQEGKWICNSKPE